MRHHAASSHPTSTKVTLNLSCQHNWIHASYSRASPAHRAQHTLAYPQAYLACIPYAYIQHTQHTAAYADYPAHGEQHTLRSILYAAVYPYLHTQHSVQLNTRHTLPGISSIPGIPRTPYMPCSTQCDISQCSYSRLMLLGGSCSPSYTLYYALLQLYRYLDLCASVSIANIPHMIALLLYTLLYRGIL